MPGLIFLYVPCANRAKSLYIVQFNVCLYAYLETNCQDNLNACADFPNVLPNGGASGPCGYGI